MEERGIEERESRLGRREGMAVGGQGGRVGGGEQCEDGGTGCFAGTRSRCTINSVR